MLRCGPWMTSPEYVIYLFSLSRPNIKQARQPSQFSLLRTFIIATRHYPRRYCTASPFRYGEEKPSHYWGQMVQAKLRWLSRRLACCGQIREQCASLEKRHVALVLPRLPRVS